MIKVLVVDDDLLVTTSLKTILNADSAIEVIGEGHNPAEAVTLYKELEPDVLLMDIRMGEGTGLDAAKEILPQFPEARILFLTTFSDDQYIIEALKIGVKGYLLKQNFEAIIPAVKTVYNGQSVFGTTIMEKLPDLLRDDSGKHRQHANDLCLTEREQNILELVAEGLNNKEIAEELFLSEGTVRNYVSLLLEKLDLRDRTQLAIFYYKKQ